MNNYQYWAMIKKRKKIKTRKKYITQFDISQPTIEYIRLVRGNLEQQIWMTYGRDFCDWLSVEIIKQAYDRALETNKSVSSTRKN